MWAGSFGFFGVFFFFFFFFVGLIMVSNGFGGTLNFRS